MVVMMLTWIELQAAHLRHNVRAFSDLVGHEKVAPVLKSNAYGHGLKEVYEALTSENLSWFVVNYVAEGAELRKLGFKGRLMVVGPFVPDELAAAAANKLEMLVGHREGVEAWLAASIKPWIHIEFDTGMGRQGFRPVDGDDVALRLSAHKVLVRGVSMHFANVEDVTEFDYANLQLERFEVARKAFTSRGFNVIAHAASSAAALILEGSRFDLVRVGISTYGFWPSQATKLSYKQLRGSLLDLKPALTWRAKITSCNDVAAGQYIGYGCSYRARHAMRIAVLPVGYFEGYPRIASGSEAYVLLHGERCPIVGRICMNMMMVDITDISGQTAVGDVATFIGVDGKEHISASDVATWSKTIHYELVTRLHPAIERRVV
jgi:alanine racemase